MTAFTQYVFYVSQAIVAMLAFKAILGARFPWETCECCGRKVRDHKTPATTQEEFYRKETFRWRDALKTAEKERDALTEEIERMRKREGAT